MGGRARASLTLLAAGAAMASPAAGAPDWSRTVAVTSEGGYRMGNPAAPVKLVEYGSLACPTCARFAADSKVPLMARVKAGTLSFEFRNYVLNGADVAASLLSRCAAAGDYFRLNDAYFAAQPIWFDRLQKAPASALAAVQALAPVEQPARIAAIAGLDAIAARGGVPAAKVRQCLADSAGIDRLATMKRAAWATYRVGGTPTFIVNGVKADGVHAWAQLAPLLRPPGG